MKEFYPKVSIVIPVYNGEKYLKYAIESALAQTYQNLEIIVVDDGSTDGTEQIAKKYEGKIRYFKKENGGVSSALNLGIEKMTGEYFSWLSHDDEYYPDKIAKEIAALTLLDNKNTIIYSNYAMMTARGKVYYKWTYDHKRLQEFQELSLLKGALNGLTLLIPKQAFVECGNFDETLYCVQDYDKWLQLLQKYPFYHLTDILTKTRVHDKQTTNVSPKVVTEGVVLWKKIMSSFSQERLIEIFGSMKSYYQEMLEFFKYTPYQEMEQYCIQQLEYLENHSNGNFNPFISIIIPVYNGSNYIQNAIESVMKQTYKNFELIVVNDGSTDDGQTENIVRSYKDKVRYFRKKNGGVASALNFGIKKAKGEYISWLSHDDVYKPYKLERQVKELNDLGDKKTILFSNFELIDQDGKVFAQTSFDQLYTQEQMENTIFPVLKGTTNGCSMLIPKEFLIDAGLFDESVRTTNDYEMWFVLFHKHPIKFMKEYLIQYRIHASQDTQSSDKYHDESEAMWTKFFQNINKTEIKRLGFDEVEFYWEFYLQMTDNGYIKTAQMLYQQFLKSYQKHDPKVSIIMPCYNASQYLEKAIVSILNQSYGNFELIVIDDHSTDDTMDILEELARKDCRIVVASNQNKKGVSGAMNTGLSLAKGEYITRMDSDDVSFKDRLKKQVEFLERNKDYDFCSVNINSIDEMDHVLIDKHYYIDDAPYEWQYLWSNPLPCAPMMYRKSVVGDIRFDEELSTAEDYNFFIQFVDHHQFYMIDEVLYSYRILSTSLSKSTLTDSNSLVIVKNYYKKIIHQDPPFYFYDLTDFSDTVSATDLESRIEVLQFVLKTLEHFKDYFHWTEEEYTSAAKYIYAKFEIYLLSSQTNDYEDRYHDILNSFSWKITKPLRFTKTALRYLKHNGIKKVVRKIVKKK